MSTAQGITALILAGGRGSRMGGIDKGLQNFRGLPLALQTLMRLQLQSLPPQDILINANRNLAAYESLGAAVWPDTLDGFAGPLAVSGPRRLRRREYCSVRLRQMAFTVAASCGSL